MNDTADYFGGVGGEASASPADLKALTEKCEEGIELQKAIDQIEIDLKAAKSAFHDLNTRVLPDMMAEIGVDKITVQGWDIKINEIVSGSLPKDPEKKAAALKYLIENEAGDIIKIDVTTPFGRGEREAAIILAKSIEQDGYAPTVKEGVHAQTLGAWARERIKNGEPVDTEVLGLYTATVAKYKEAK